MFIVPLHKALSSMPKQSYPMMLDLIKSEVRNRYTHVASDKASLLFRLNMIIPEQKKSILSKQH